MKLTLDKVIALRDLQNQLIPVLDELCERYFEETEPDWMFYNEWEFGDDNKIYLHYSYHNYENETSECGYEVVDIKTLLAYNDR